MKIDPEKLVFTAKAYPLPLELQLHSASSKSTKTFRTLPMRAVHFPVVSNTATTGFKLEGASLCPQSPREECPIDETGNA